VKTATKTRKTRRAGLAPSLVRQNWREHAKRWVNGCIDSYGAIHAVATVEIEMHKGNTQNGKRWRWNIGDQDFSSLAPRTVEEANNRIVMLHLNEEEHFTVCDWLIRHGYASDDILPNIKRTDRHGN
jgi:hypothetical protein